MSTKMFEQFIEELGTSADLQRELYDLAGDDGAVRLEDVLSFASEKGYEFGAEDISGELSEDELDSVAGGALFPKVEINTLLSTTDTSFIKMDYDNYSSFLKFY